MHSEKFNLPKSIQSQKHSYTAVTGWYRASTAKDKSKQQRVIRSMEGDRLQSAIAPGLEKIMASHSEQNRFVKHPSAAADTTKTTHYKNSFYLTCGGLNKTQVL